MFAWVTFEDLINLKGVVLTNVNTVLSCDIKVQNHSQKVITIQKGLNI